MPYAQQAEKLHALLTTADKVVIIDSRLQDYRLRASATVEGQRAVSRLLGFLSVKDNSEGERYYPNPSGGPAIQFLVFRNQSSKATIKVYSYKYFTVRYDDDSSYIFDLVSNSTENLERLTEVLFGPQKSLVMPVPTK